MIMKLFLYFKNKEKIPINLSNFVYRNFAIFIIIIELNIIYKIKLIIYN